MTREQIIQALVNEGLADTPEEVEATLVDMDVTPEELWKFGEALLADE